MSSMKKALLVVGALVVAFLLWGRHLESERVARHEAEAASTPARSASVAAMVAEQKAEQAQYDANKRQMSDAQYQAQAKAAAASILAKRREDDGMAKAVAGAQAIRNMSRDPSAVRFLSVEVMESGAVCYDFVAPNGFGGPSHEHGIVPPNATRVYAGDDAARAQGYNRHCAGKHGADYTAMAKQLSQ